MNGPPTSLREDEEVLKMDSSDGCATVRMGFTPPNCALQDGYSDEVCCVYCITMHLGKKRKCAASTASGETRVQDRPSLICGSSGTAADLPRRVQESQRPGSSPRLTPPRSPRFGTAALSGKTRARKSPSFPHLPKFLINLSNCLPLVEGRKEAELEQPGVPLITGSRS